MCATRAAIYSIRSKHPGVAALGDSKSGERRKSPFKSEQSSAVAFLITTLASNPDVSSKPMHTLGARLSNGHAQITAVWVHCGASVRGRRLCERRWRGPTRQL